MRLTTCDMSYNWIVLMMKFKHKLLNQLILISLMAKFNFDIPVSSPLNYVENSFHRIGRILDNILASHSHIFLHSRMLQLLNLFLLYSSKVILALSRRMRITGFRLITMYTVPGIVIRL